jgi:hypothetical protein
MYSIWIHSSVRLVVRIVSLIHSPSTATTTAMDKTGERRGKGQTALYADGKQYMNGICAGKRTGWQ